MAGEIKEVSEISKEPEIKEKKTFLGIEERIEGVLCYSLLFITGIFFLMIERENKFVRFHALQSIATFVPLYIIVNAIERIISMPTIGFSITLLGLTTAILISAILWILITVIWILLMYKASRGEMYKLPLVGRIAEKYS